MKWLGILILCLFPKMGFAWGIDQMTNAEEMARQKMVVIGEPSVLQDNDSGYGGYIFYEQDLKTDPMLACKIHQRHPNALLMLDQEGGEVVRLKVKGAIPPPPSLVHLMTPAAYQKIAKSVAQTLRRYCLDINLAPVIEPTHGSYARSPSSDMRVVHQYSLAFGQGMVDGGIMPTLKHFPGATQYNDYIKGREGDIFLKGEARVVKSDQNGNIESHMRDFLFPFSSMVMMSLNIYEGYSNVPALMNETFYHWLRVDLGFKGVIITDDLNELKLPPEAIMKIAQNADLIMVCDNEHSSSVKNILTVLMTGISSGEIPQSTIRKNVARIKAVRDAVTSGQITSRY